MIFNKRYPSNVAAQQPIGVIGQIFGLHHILCLQAVSCWESKPSLLAVALSIKISIVGLYI